MKINLASVRCYVCKLMTTLRSLLAHGGFSNWKHVSTRLANHEKSEEHHRSVLSLARRSLEIGQIDHGLTQQAQQIEQYWQSVLKRKVLTFLRQRSLALRGDNQVIGSVRNGNYLGILELLSECNDVVIRLPFYRLYRYLRVDDQVVNLGLLYYSPTVSKNLNAHINKGLNNFSDLRRIRYERITKYKEFTYAFESLHYT